MADRIIRGRVAPGKAVAEIRLAAGRVAAVTLAAPSPAGGAGDAGCIVSEGFLDIQVNGFAGVDFNRPALTPSELRQSTEVMWRCGVTRFFPTVITAPLESIAGTLTAIRRAREEDRVLARTIPGVHLEGPFLSPEDGPRGAHPRAYIRDPDWETYQRLQEAAGGLIRLVTVAPERPGALDLIRRLTEAGTVVAIGHSDAGEADIDAAVLAGARLSTHLGNGAHAVLPRHRNYIQKQLASDGLFASIIADGHHLTEFFVQNVVRCKGPERVILVTDAMAAAASSPGLYRLGEVLAEASPDGVVRLPGTPYLAGSALTLDRAVDNVRRFAGISVGCALAMVTQQPRCLWPDLPGGVVPGAPADLVLLGNGERLEVLETVIGGETVYRATERAPR